MYKIAKYALYDIIRNRIVIAYMLFLLLVSFAFFNLQGDGAKGILSLLNIILIVVPMVSIIFSTIHFYNSYEFIELLSAQPLKRKTILLGEYIGIATALAIAVLIGIGLPIVLFEATDRGFLLLLVGLFLTLIFVSFAFLGSVFTRDKAKGIGVALLLWFYFSLIYDGIVLLILFSFSDYPLEKVTTSLILLNPVDLGRVLMLLKLDTSALMGYTGAIFKELFGTTTGMSFAIVILATWVIVPLLFAVRVFGKKDL